MTSFSRHCWQKEWRQGRALGVRKRWRHRLHQMLKPLFSIVAAAGTRQSTRHLHLSWAHGPGAFRAHSSRLDIADPSSKHLQRISVDTIIYVSLRYWLLFQIYNDTAPTVCWACIMAFLEGKKCASTIFTSAAASLIPFHTFFVCSSSSHCHLGRDHFY